MYDYALRDEKVSEIYEALSYAWGDLTTIGEIFLKNVGELEYNTHVCCSYPLMSA